MKLDTNEWEATVDSWRMFPNYDMIDYDRIRIDDIKTFIHQQLQKAREDGYNAGLADDDDDIPPLPKGKTLDDLIKDVWVDHSELDHLPDRPLNS